MFGRVSAAVSVVSVVLGLLTGVGPGPAAAATAPVLPANAVDPGEPGPYATTTGEYELAPVQLPGIDDPVEMTGLVVAPQGTTGPRPLVLLLHGHHEPCYSEGDGGRLSWFWPCPEGFRHVPSYRGHLPVQRLLASWGYLTVSVSATAVDAQDWLPDDGGAQARSSLVRRHLAHWADWADRGRAGAPDVVRAAPPPDLGRVLLVGHSRGGEGVNRAAMDSLVPPPAGADDGPGAARWTVRGLVLLAPTAFGQNPVADVPSVTLLGSCDGDVQDLQGQLYVDATRGVGAGTALHGSVYVVGANHNYFNTEWTPGRSVAPAKDDYSSVTPNAVCTAGTAPDRLTGDEQQAVAATYVAAAARLFLSGEDAVRPLLDGSAVRAPSAGRARVQSHALGAGRTPLAVAGASTAVTGAGARTCQLVGSDDGCDVPGSIPALHAAPFGPGASAEPDRQAVELAWTGAGGQPVTLRPAAPVSLTGADAVTMRVFVPAGSPAGSPTTRLGVAVVDGAGRRAELGGATVEALPGLGDRAAEWAQEVRLPLSAAAASGVDLAAVTALELTPRDGAGRAWLLDAWGWRPGTPDPRTGPVTRLDLGDSALDDGNGPTGTLRARVTVTGSGPGQVWILVLGPDGRETSRLVTVSPGDQALDLPVPAGGPAPEGSSWTVLAKAARATVVGRCASRAPVPAALAAARAR